MRLDNSGRLGVGTTSPSHKLDIVGGGLEITQQETTDAIALLDSNNSDTKYLSIQGDNGDCNINAPAGSLVLQQGGTSRVTVSSGGAAISGGITASSGSNRIELSTDGSIEITRSTVPFIDFKTSTSEDFDCRIQEQSNGLAFSTGGNGSTGERLRIDSSGNLGLGTSSPTGKLNIVSGSSGSYLVNLDYNDGTDGGGFFQSGSVGLSLFLKNASATQTVQIATAGDSYFNGGDVGIGTSSPATNFHVTDGEHHQHFLELILLQQLQAVMQA